MKTSRRKTVRHSSTLPNCGSQEGRQLMSLARGDVRAATQRYLPAGHPGTQAHLPQRAVGVRHLDKETQAAALVVRSKVDEREAAPRCGNRTQARA